LLYNWATFYEENVDEESGQCQSGKFNPR
jgi:hypothetical protein